MGNSLGRAPVRRSDAGMTTGWMEVGEFGRKERYGNDDRETVGNSLGRAPVGRSDTGRLLEAVTSGCEGTPKSFLQTAAGSTCFITRPSRVAWRRWIVHTASPRSWPSTPAWAGQKFCGELPTEEAKRHIEPPVPQDLQVLTVADGAPTLEPRLPEEVASRCGIRT